MIESNQIVLSKALAYLNTIESVIILSVNEKKIIDFNESDIVWKVFTEIEENTKGIGVIELYIKIGEDFPLSFPRLYLSKESYEKIKYIPHIDTDRFICTYDTETSRPNPDYPERIIPECIIKAKRIISEGICKRNFADFEVEFLAYWRQRYSEKDIILENFLSLFNIDAKIDRLSILETETTLGGYKYFLHTNDEQGDRFKEYLKSIKKVFTEYECFYNGEINITFNPPFDYDNGQTLSLINPAKHKEFEKFINSNKINCKIVISKTLVAGKMVFIGWAYKKLNTNRNGFRANIITPFYVLNTFQKNDKVARIAPQIFTKERLVYRTSGETIQKNWCFLIAGVGSIGSHLAHFLSSLNYPDLKLIDKDNLIVENTGRHLLGLSYVHQYKTLAIKTHLQLNNPLQKIETKQEFIQTVLTSTPEFINNTDYIFLTTGNTNVENWIGEKISEGIITKPVFFIWIEPFLSAGHCIYIHPKSYNYSDYFTETGYLKYNVIAEDYYNNHSNTLILKEGGCQTTYVPYSANNICIFISTIFSKICNIIENKITESKCYTWIGDIDTLIEKGVEISQYANKKVKGDIIENVL